MKYLTYHVCFEYTVSSDVLKQDCIIRTDFEVADECYITN